MLEEVDDLDAPGGVEDPAPAPPQRAVGAAAAAAAHGRRVEAGRLRVGAAVDERLQEVEAVVGAVADEVGVVELDRSAQLDHRRGRAADGGDPVGQLGSVADRGRQAHQLHVRREVDDHLLPDGTAVGVLEEVDLVEDDEAEVAEVPGAAVDHVAQDLGRHHHDRGVAVDHVVAGEQPDRLDPVALPEVAELLVRQRLQRRRVEGPATLAAGRPDAVLGDDRLAAAGRGGDDDVAAGVERIDGVELEAVERERVAREQCSEVCRPPLRRRRFGHGVAAAGSSRRRRWAIQPMPIERT